jgi:hypothetical protein
MRLEAAEGAATESWSVCQVLGAGNVTLCVLDAPEDKSTTPASTRARTVKRWLVTPFETGPSAW